MSHIEVDRSSFLIAFTIVASIVIPCVLAMITNNQNRSNVNTGNMILLTSESGANIHATEYVDTETGIHYIMWYDPALDASAITVRFGSTGEPIKEGD